MGATSNIPPADPFATLAQRQRPPSEQVHQRLTKEIERDSTPKRGLSRNARLSLSAVLLLVGLLSTSLRALSQSPMVLLTVGTFASVVLGYGVLLGTAPGRTDRFSLTSRKALLSFLLIGVLVMLASHSADFVALSELLTKGHLTRLFGCATQSFITGGLCTTLLVYTWRGTDPFTPGMTGALLGAIAGLLATLGVGVVCSSVEGFHLMLSHGATVLGLSALGALAGRRWLCP